MGRARVCSVLMCQRQLGYAVVEECAALTLALPLPMALVPAALEWAGRASRPRRQATS